MKEAKSKPLPSAPDRKCRSKAKIHHLPFLNPVEKRRLQSCKAYINIFTFISRSQVGHKPVIAGRKRLHVHFCKLGATHLSKPLAVFKTAKTPSGYKKLTMNTCFWLQQVTLVFLPIRSELLRRRWHTRWHWCFQWVGWNLSIWKRNE